VLVDTLGVRKIAALGGLLAGVGSIFGGLAQQGAQEGVVFQFAVHLVTLFNPQAVAYKRFEGGKLPG
ncbi:MAG: hypothetical protein Q8K43_01630, partial [Sulfurimicrobium sp.]|nr:hypothetical protein [Sulfurimicrobium sp.]